MPFGAHETMEVHEILGEKINLMNHFSLYKEQCQDQQIRQMLDRHIQTAMQSYDQLVAYTHNYNAAGPQNQAVEMPNVRPEQIQYGLHNPSQHMPSMKTQFNDQQILSFMLSCHKNSAKNHIAGSLECADPNVRNMLVQGAVTCANQAYEVFTFMNQQGHYQVPTMQDHTAKTFLHSYQPTHAQNWQQSAGQMPNQQMNATVQ